MFWRPLHCVVSNITPQMHFVQKCQPNALLSSELNLKLNQGKIPRKKTTKVPSQKVIFR